MSYLKTMLQQLEQDFKRTKKDKNYLDSKDKPVREQPPAESKINKQYIHDNK